MGPTYWRTDGTSRAPYQRKFRGSANGKMENIPSPGLDWRTSGIPGGRSSRFKKGKRPYARNFLLPRGLLRVRGDARQPGKRIGAERLPARRGGETRSPQSRSARRRVAKAGLEGKVARAPLIGARRAEEGQGCVGSAPPCRPRRGPLAAGRVLQGNRRRRPDSICTKADSQATRAVLSRPGQSSMDVKTGGIPGWWVDSASTNEPRQWRRRAGKAVTSRHAPHHRTYRQHRLDCLGPSPPLLAPLVVMAASQTVLQTPTSAEARAACRRGESG